MTIHNHSHYAIVNVANNKALDGNISAMPDKTHPRVYLWDYQPHAANHQWTLKHVEGDYYLVVNRASGKALDGNTGVPQTQSSHPVPFLWEPQHNAVGQQWRFEKVDHDTYLLVNRATGKALDGNFNGCTQPHPALPTPFLWEAQHHAANHRWRLHHHH